MSPVSLNGISGSALSGLTTASAALSVVSSNVANVNTAGYARRVVNEQTLSAGGQLVGVDIASIERVADQIGILANGNLRVSEPLDSLKDSVRQVRFFDFKNGIPPGQLLGSFRTVRSGDELLVTLRTSPTVTPESIAQRWSCQCETRPLSLEDIFIELSLN